MEQKRGGGGAAALRSGAQRVLPCMHRRHSSERMGGCSTQTRSWSCVYGMFARALWLTGRSGAWLIRGIDPLRDSDVAPVLRARLVRQNARVTVIQGCISVGALIKGQTQIVGYLRNVREALTACFDFVSLETMTAFMVVAYCHDLMGNAAATR